MLGTRASSSSVRDSISFSSLSYTLIVISALLAFGVVLENPWKALLLAAILCGWSEADGRCGTSHLCALRPLYEFDRRLWLRAVSAYTLGGTISGSCVGAFLGLIGSAIGPVSPHLFTATAGLAMVLAVRELGWVRFRLPEVPLQTEKMWAAQFGFVTAAGMWGTHIGLAYATVIKHGGVFVMGLLAVALGPLPGSVVMATYWIGRALPIWAGPACLPDGGMPGDLAKLIRANEKCMQRAAATGLSAAAAAAVVFAL